MLSGSASRLAASHGVIEASSHVDNHQLTIEVNRSQSKSTRIFVLDLPSLEAWTVTPAVPLLPVTRARTRVGLWIRERGLRSRAQAANAGQNV